MSIAFLSRSCMLFRSQPAEAGFSREIVSSILSFDYNKCKMKNPNFVILDELLSLLLVPYIHKYRKGVVLLQKIFGHKSLP